MRRRMMLLLKEISVGNILNIEINILDIPNFGNKLIQFRRMGQSTRHKWVKLSRETAPFPCSYANDKQIH